MVHFQTTISLFEVMNLYSYTEQFEIHTVVKALGSVVDVYTILSLHNLCRVLELEEISLAY